MTQEGAYLSAHLGDLDSAAAYDAFRDDLRLYLEMLSIEPEAVAHDLHPERLDEVGEPAAFP